jgi:aminoglycoside phosphotransferase family enzyme/predicted kinase
MQTSSTLDRHEALIGGLLSPAAYPHAVERVERIDTHISTVLLAGEFAYKIKKPVDLGFLDFSSLEKRLFFCGEELRLNRRTAPQLYLDVVPIVAAPGGLRVGPADGEPVEYAVRMRRFDPRDTLDEVARAGRLTGDLVDRLAVTVAQFHADAARAPSAFGSPQTAGRLVDAAIDAMRGLVSSAHERARLDAIAAWTTAQGRALADAMAARAAAGCVRECHGDLHLGNIVLLDGAPVPFDGIEFNDELRYIDVIADAAFAFMDLLDHEVPHLAWRFVGRYLEHSGDYEGLAVLRWYAVYRALVRAEVALIRLHQAPARRHVRLREHTTFEHYLALAERLSRSAAHVLVVMTGLSGSGKSSVAFELAQQLDGVRVRTDLERKRLYGFAPHARTDASIYTAEATARTYARVEQAARVALAAGVPVVVDGALLRRAERARFRALAREFDARFALVACEAAADVLRARVESRYRAGTDPSEADVAVLERQMQWREPTAPDELAEGVEIDTNADWSAVESQCRALARRLRPNPD